MNITQFTNSFDACVGHATPKFKLGQRLKSKYGSEYQIVADYVSKDKNSDTAYDIKIWDGSKLVGEKFVTERDLILETR